MNNKHSSCARNRNENRTVIFYARKHGIAAPCRPAALAAPQPDVRESPRLARYFFRTGPSPLSAPPK